jgi:lysophospholipase L1-like esterase
MKSFIARITALAVSFFAGAVFVLHAEPVLQPGDRVAICGDSITEQKRYSLLIAEYLLMCQPVADVRTNQFGLGGELARGLLPRLQTDVLPFKPTVVTTCYGMNDGGYTPSDPVKQAMYREALENLIAAFRKGGVRSIVIGSPGVVDSFYFKRDVTAAVYNQTLGGLGQVAQEVAAKAGVGFADVHSVMLDVMQRAKAKRGEKYPVAGTDGVHPQSNGHLIMAYAFLKALGVSGDIGSLSLDWQSGQATASNGHKVLAARQGTVELESTHYPFCFETSNPVDQDNTASILEFLPFNDDLNRLMLTVKNVPAGSYQVVWGAGSKIFAANDLAKGINLAAQFLDNPFKAAFLKAQTAIAKQQQFESVSNRTLLHYVMDLKREFPGGEGDATTSAIQKLVLEKAHTLEAAAEAAVVPVKHLITITPVR